MNSYLDALAKYGVFHGRSKRETYWRFMLFHFLVLVALYAIDKLTGTYSREAGMGLLGTVYFWATIIPAVAIGVRRTHDVGLSGWWHFVPLVNIILLIKKGQRNDNQYGDNPYRV